MKQTAVEWLVEQLNKKAIINGTIDRVVMNYIIEQSKEMERDQLILFGAQCMVETEKESGLGAIKIYELYFDKTFKSE
jgi:hypothetical protein